MKPNLGMTRRHFVTQTGCAAAAGVALSGFPALNVRGAGEKIALGFIGVGGRGSYHLREFAEMNDVHIVAASDPDQRKLDRVKAAFPQVQLYQDFRRVLERRDLDAVVISTPDHWHAIPAILACQAGKDVYVEKPLGHNIREGRAMVQAARRYERVVQLGTQQRSGPHWIEAVDLIRSGGLGQVSLVRAWNCWDLRSMHADMGKPADQPAPDGLDYDLWLGPAPLRPFNPRHFDFYFYYFWDYSGGMLSAWGVHLFDIVTWAMGPAIQSVTTTGGKFVFPDARETPDSAAVLFECPNYVWTYEVRHGNGNPPWGGMDHGLEFYGTQASLWINRNGYTLCPENDRAHPKQVPSQGMEIQHKRNFLDCVRSRQRPNSDVELGHLGSIPGHLGNIAYRVGRRIAWDGTLETIPNDAEAQALLGRTYRAPWTLPRVEA
ncbi:MAG: Gfo/Idh/MocA family oxidoreductase [Verrucomicrobia bacterium]|nr:Gfo/Idh/MocA family oxidoreductase [Verrucomicrobiota bacterium]